MPGRPRVWRSAAAAAACRCPGQWCCGVGVKVVRWPEEQQQQHQHQHSTALSTCQDTLTIITFLYMQRTLLAFMLLYGSEKNCQIIWKMQSFGNETINQTHDSHLIWLDARTGVLRNWVQNMQWTWPTLFLCLLNLHSELISSVYARGVDLDRGILRSWHNCTHFNINCTQQGEYSPLRRYLRYSSFYADWVRVQIRAIRLGQTMGGWEAVGGGNKILRNIMQATSPCWGTLPV